MNETRLVMRPENVRSLLIMLNQQLPQKVDNLFIWNCEWWKISQKLTTCFVPKMKLEGENVSTDPPILIAILPTKQPIPTTYCYYYHASLVWFLDFYFFGKRKRRWRTEIKICYLVLKWNSTFLDHTSLAYRYMA